MRPQKARAASLACCLTLLAAPALAQTGPAIGTATAPAPAPAAAAVPDAAPPAQRPRMAGSPVPVPTWRDYGGGLVSIYGNKLSEPERMAAGKPYTPLPWGSVVQGVPGMNAGPSIRPLPPGTVVNTQASMTAGKPFTWMPAGVIAETAPGMRAGPAPRPLPAGRTPDGMVRSGG